MGAREFDKVNERRQGYASVVRQKFVNSVFRLVP
jgi:hypothetical protein